MYNRIIKVSHVLPPPPRSTRRSKMKRLTSTCPCMSTLDQPKCLSWLELTEYIFFQYLQLEKGDQGLPANSQTSPFFPFHGVRCHVGLLICLSYHATTKWKYNEKPRASYSDVEMRIHYLSELDLKGLLFKFPFLNETTLSLTLELKLQYILPYKYNILHYSELSDLRTWNEAK